MSALNYEKRKRTMTDNDLAILKDPAAFKQVWLKKPKGILRLLDGMQSNLFHELACDESGEFLHPSWEWLPMIHSDKCVGDEPNNALAHFFCERPRVFRPNEHKAFYGTIRSRMLAVLHPENLALMHDTILDLPRTVKAEYLELPLVADDHWEPLADDRQLVNSVVSNPFLPDRMAKILAERHKTPSVRIAIAHNTADNGILNDIWHGTKSEDIRTAVQENAAFVKLTYFSNNKGLR